ncbi:unannotated protein [freshwater metagenome]|uniref:Unannotated protein n=1 Tax=freshwater metagenome TaxID=449393 RepID=A0A6J7R4N8_9ZZZZ
MTRVATSPGAEPASPYGPQSRTRRTVASRNSSLARADERTASTSAAQAIAPRTTKTMASAITPVLTALHGSPFADRSTMMPESRRA